MPGAEVILVQGIKIFAPLRGVALDHDVKHRVTAFERVTLFATAQGAVDPLMGGLGETE